MGCLTHVYQIFNNDLCFHIYFLEMFICVHISEKQMCYNLPRTRAHYNKI